MSTAEIHLIDAAYIIEFKIAPKGIRVEDMSGDTAPHTYTPPHSSYLYYYTAYGVWRRTTGSGKWEFSKECNERRRNYSPTIIRECGIPEMKGKHYDALIVDDMQDAFAYAMKGNTEKEVKLAIDWHKMMEEGERKMKEDLDKQMFSLPLETAKRRRQGILTNITEGGNEMGDEMHKELYHVILFNRKTEEIDFKEYIPAKCKSDAIMQAAQAYGKYGSTLHRVIVKQIEGSEYTVLE